MQGKDAGRAVEPHAPQLASALLLPVTTHPRERLHAGGHGRGFGVQELLLEGPWGTSRRAACLPCTPTPGQ